MVDFSIVYTTHRIQVAEAVLRSWLGHASNPLALEVIVSVDADYDDGIELLPGILKRLAVDYPGTFFEPVLAPVPGNCVKGWNAGAAKATGRAIVALSDDFTAFQGWDTELKALRQSNLWLRDGKWMDGDYAVHVHDGLHGDLCTLAIITAARYRKFGYLYYPKYESMYADTELTHKAAQDNALINALYLTFPHLHHSKPESRVEDEVDKRHNSAARYKTGELLFSARRAVGFPTDRGPEGVKYRLLSESDIGSHYAVFIQAIKDDFCLFETVKRLVEQGLRNFFFSIPDEYWSGAVTPVEDVDEVKSIARAVAALAPGVQCRVVVQPVRFFREGAKNRIEVETRCRNSMLDRIAAAGFKHVIVCDGDELWKRGFMHSLHEIVARKAPGAVTCRNVPVLGLPGYPVDDARDRVLVYIRGDQRFATCRSPHCRALDLEEFGLFHLSGVRENFDEVVKKMRDSGHYDDPSYKFEDFISKTLPNVTPGMKNIHMYSGYQIWPSIRRFREDELKDIPVSIQQHLDCTPAAPAPVVIPTPSENAYA